MKYPSVTILVTIKNSARTMKMCIDSLLELDYPNYEIMVIDAFSTDGTYEILKSYGNKIKLYQVKGWAPVAYNWALDKIDTEYIALIDGDNKVTKDWLKNLMLGFDSTEVAEVAGFCANPEESSGLQKLLGRDLEMKYRKMGKYIDKAPSMNVAFKTEIARKIKFDEKARVGYDVVFSFEISKLGKIRYVPDAVVYHYHRATWKNFFRQQYTYAKHSPKIYLRYKSKVKGGEITTPTMIMQPFIAYFIVLFLLLGFVLNILFYFSAALLLFLFALYVKDAVKLSKSIKEFFTYIIIFLVRTIALAIGFIASMF